MAEPSAATPGVAPIRLKDLPALAAGQRGATWYDPETGEIERISHRDAARRISNGDRPIVCHRKATGRRLGIGPFRGYDLLELYAFVRPAQFCLPTPRGLAEALDLPLPRDQAAEAETLVRAARALLMQLYEGDSRDAPAIAWAMARGGWEWGPLVLAAVGAGDRPPSRRPLDSLEVWHLLSAWEEHPPEGPPGTFPVEAVEARARLVQLLGSRSEERPGQKSYAGLAAQAFAPRERSGAPKVVVAEAGTGTGKTLGYVAPASIWAEKNRAPVWISTFTRNLQRQLDSELDRLCPDTAEKRERVVIRKGRENYFCLLNYEEALKRLAAAAGGSDAVALGLMARWALQSRDGDMVGGDFPGWLVDLVGRGMTVDLTDTRGECIYSACPHYGKCFIEHAVRRARNADIVVANHALVMVQAAFGDAEALPLRYVFDEGHHLFQAADGAFSAALSGWETAELRRWVLGAEGGARSRSRGLKARIEDLIAGDERAREALDEALEAARALPGPGWHQRIAEGRPTGPAEAFLALVRQQVYARDANTDSPYSLECPPHPAVPGLLDAAERLSGAVARLGKPLGRLVQSLSSLLDDEAEELDSQARIRIEAMVKSLERRGLTQCAAWRDMLTALSEQTPADFVDWFGVERAEGRDLDVAFHRHWLDPTVPFAKTVLEPAHGALITSATLRDASGDDETDWQAAMARTGVAHLDHGGARVLEPSPFDYPATTRVFVVGDVDKRDPDQVAAAYRELFQASGGGGLGLFTAISRLRGVHKRIAGALEDAGIPLLAQHVDALDPSTLVEIFRAEESACLLGTDAMRDGVDVPGRSLRLIVFDRTPWPRPDLLHKARREAFGGRQYDEMLTRLKIKQAYGRLVRRADDRGVFVMLDRAFPSRLATAFPNGVEVRRVGLKETIAEIRAFLQTAAETG